MIKRVFRQCTREPMTCIAAILFTAVLAVILCFLHRSQLEEQKNFENIYAIKFHEKVGGEVG